MRLVALAALAVLALAANSPLTRAGVADGTDPLVFAGLRVAAGAAVLVLLARGRPPLRGRRRWGAALALAAYLLGFSLAYRSLDAGLGAFVLFGTVQVALMGAGLARGERLPARAWIGAAAALAGLGALMLPGAGAGAALDLALMAGAGLAWAGYSLAGKGEAAGAIPATAGNFVLATAMLLPVVALAGGGATSGGVAWALLSGGITSGLGYALLYTVLPRLAVSTAGVVQLGAPVAATAMGAAFLGEAVTPAMALAGALVLGGIALATQPTIRSKGS